MNRSLIKEEVQEFILNYNGPADRLAFSGSPFDDVATRELLEQVEGRRRIEKKLPGWYNTTGIVYPPKINLEQCSSEATATYKASLVQGGVMADITGGYGIDTFHFAKQFKEVNYFETNRALSDIVQHNLKRLGASNVHIHNEDGTAGVKSIRPEFIYLDPSRRHEQKGKVVLLEDCEPDLTEHLETLVGCADKVMVKLSPMFDISLGIKGLKYVVEVHVVSVRNEVRELLFLLDKSNDQIPKIIAVNLDDGTSGGTMSFDFGASQQTEMGDPLTFVYEPNASIMKSGGFVVFGPVFGLKKLAVNTHLFTSEALIDCPARKFRVTKSMEFNKREIKKELQGAKANISVRNFPVTVAELRKKFRIRDGGDRYVFFTSLQDDRRVVLFCEKVS